jgi:RNA polymerase sigma factor (sigma-70 family)
VPAEARDVSESQVRELGNRLRARDVGVRRAAVAALSERLRAPDAALRCEAAKALFEHFRDPLRRHIRCELARWRQSAPSDDAFHSRIETHVNSALLLLLERLEKSPLGEQPDVNFLAYVKVIVRNALMTRQRRDMRARREPAGQLNALPAREPAVDEQLASTEERQCHEAALAVRRQRLSAAEQRVVDLYSAGLTYRQIADKLGGSPGQYRAWMGRIIRKLR